METRLRISQICSRKAIVGDISHFYSFVYMHICQYISCLYYYIVFIIILSNIVWLDQHGSCIIMVNYLFSLLFRMLFFIAISRSYSNVLIDFYKPLLLVFSFGKSFLYFFYYLFLKLIMHYVGFVGCSLFYSILALIKVVWWHWLLLILSMTLGTCICALSSWQIVWIIYVFMGCCYVIF